MSTCSRSYRGYVSLCAGLLAGVTLSLASGTVRAASSYPSQALWIQNADQFLQTAGWDNLDAFMWFHKDKLAIEGYDWRLNRSGSAAAYNQGINGLAPGVYLDGFPHATGVIDTFEATVGQHQTRIGWFESLMSPFPTADVQAIQARGSIPYIVLEPFDYTLGDDAYHGPSRLQPIADGYYDSFPNDSPLGLERWAEAAAALKGSGQRIEISFAHEMNGQWFTWGLQHATNGNTPALYIDAFQHVVDVFRAAGADNVDFVWTINASWQDDFSAAFPGVDYVDRMGMNGYNRGDFPPGTHATWEADFYRDWREFEEIFGAWDPFNPGGVHNYNKLVEIATAGGNPAMPIIIGEFSSTPEPATMALLVLGAAALMRRRRSCS